MLVCNSLQLNEMIITNCKQESYIQYESWLYVDESMLQKNDNSDLV